MKTQRRVEVWLYSFFNLGVKWGWVVKAILTPFNPRERDPVPLTCTSVLTYLFRKQTEPST
jgi:hypothetical protein